MQTIYKYPLAIAGEQVVMMPQGASIIAVAEQHGTLCVWAEVDPDAPSVGRAFRIIGTGCETKSGTHIGTVLMGAFVWHVYEAAA